MEEGTPVWVRDSRGEDAWLPAAVVRRVSAVFLLLSRAKSGANEALTPAIRVLCGQTGAADGGCEVVVRIEGSREERPFR
jgi:hypothetical protein